MQYFYQGVNLLDSGLSEVSTGSLCAESLLLGRPGESFSKVSNVTNGSSNNKTFTCLIVLSKLQSRLLLEQVHQDPKQRDIYFCLFVCLLASHLCIRILLLKRLQLQLQLKKSLHLVELTLA